MLTIQQDEVMVPVVPGPDTAGRVVTLPARPPAAKPVKRGRRSAGVFLDGVIWVGIFAAASGFGQLAAAIYDDVRTLAGF